MVAQPQRKRLDSRGLLLLCVRFQRNAVVTALAKDWSSGEGCYLVRPNKQIDARTVAFSLGAAEPDDVVTSEEADRYHHEWYEGAYGKPWPW